LQPLNLDAIARELGEKDAATLRQKIGERRLCDMGLGTLLEANGTLNRGEWEAGRTRSLMQRIAVELDLTPLRVAD